VAIRNTDPDRDTDPEPDPYRDTGKTCLGGGMHCSSASSLMTVAYLCQGRCFFAQFVHLMVVLTAFRMIRPIMSVDVQSVVDRHVVDVAQSWCC